MIWIAAFNTTFILGYLLLDLIFFPSPLSRSTYSPTSKLKVQPDPTVLAVGKRNARGIDGADNAPVLLEAINYNGLILFLLVSIRDSWICQFPLATGQVCSVKYNVYRPIS